MGLCHVIRWSIIILLLGPAAAFADSVTERASKAYDEGNYVEANRLYESIVDRGVVNGHLFFNIGNASFKKGEVGAAVAAYLAARRFLPRDPDVKANLKAALDMAPDKLDVTLQRSSMVERFMALLGVMTPKEFGTGAAFAFALTGVLLLLMGLKFPWTSLRPFRGGLFATFVVACFLTLGSVLTYFWTFPWGAVTSHSVKVYSEPGTANTVLFELHEGSPFVTRGRVPGWLQIELSDGKEGWVPDSDARVYAYSDR